MVKKIHGKFRLKASTILMPCESKIDARVYVHLKGYARARVTHLDIEKIGLGKVIRRGRGNFLEIRGVDNGLEVVLREKCRLALDAEDVTVSSIIVTCSVLNGLIEKDTSTHAWVGRKYDGIYIGFRRLELKKLEKLASRRFKVKPLSKLQESPLTIKRQKT